MASTDLSRTPASAGNRKTFTLSTWVKRGQLGSNQDDIFSAGTNSGSAVDEIHFRNDDQIRIYSYDSAYLFQYITTRKFRDTSAWYHIVLAVDTTQATASDRVKLYVNGDLITDFDTETDPSQNADCYFWNTTNPHHIGSTLNGARFLTGSLAHFHFIDGTAYDASAFGETDATTGIWKPKLSPSVTYGTNGFFLKFENSGAFGTDSSGNGNNFTVNGTMTQTLDTPSNVFATGNPLYRLSNNNLFSNGNLTFTGSSESYPGNVATFQPSAGKWYWETKINTKVSNPLLGMAWNGYTSGGTGRIMYRADGYILTPDATETSGYATFTNGDILGFALDLDSATTTLKFYKNNTLIYTYNNLTTGLQYSTRGEGMLYWQLYTNDVVSANFGNGYFGTTAVASANADDNGIGAFEYAPPTGYLALCTKNINAQEYS